MHGWEVMSNQIDGEMTEWRRTSTSDHKKVSLDRGESIVEIGHGRSVIMVREKHVQAVRSQVNR